MNSNTLQAYLVCFYRHLRKSDDAIFASTLFWLGLYTNQAHPLLCSISLNLMHAAVECISQSRVATGASLHAVLMNARSGNAILEEATRELDTSIEVRFTEANFSFAMAALLAKNMHEEHLCNHAVGQSRLQKSLPCHSC